MASQLVVNVVYGIGVETDGFPDDLSRSMGFRSVIQYRAQNEPQFFGNMLLKLGVESVMNHDLDDILLRLYGGEIVVEYAGDAYAGDVSEIICAKLLRPVVIGYGHYVALDTPLDSALSPEAVNAITRFRTDWNPWCFNFSHSRRTLDEPSWIAAASLD